MRIASYQDWPQLVPALLHFLSAPWRWISTRTRLWANALAFLSTRCLPATTLAASLADATPLTEEQRANRKAEFIQSIDREAICALASRHNHGLPCRLDASEPTANGSFNVCFFVEFHTTAERTQWVVRVPIEPVISRTWEKVQSEVCTIRSAILLLPCISPPLNLLFLDTFERTHRFPFRKSTHTAEPDYDLTNRPRTHTI